MGQKATLKATLKTTLQAILGTTVRLTREPRWYGARTGLTRDWHGTGTHVAGHGWDLLLPWYGATAQ